MKRLRTLRDQGVISALDFHFAGSLRRFDTEIDSDVLLAAALVSAWRERGHICLHMPSLTEELLYVHARETAEEELECVALPEPELWQAKLRANRVVARPDDYAPLILDESGRLYLQRYWKYESEVAKQILDRAALPDGGKIESLGEGVKRLFAMSSENPNDQRVAAFMALRRRFSVISGGPGTGKTSTVVKILALLVEQAGDERIHIGLSAPTGKAAARLKESIQGAKDKLPVSKEILDAIPEEAFTIHRLLGYLPGSTHFRHDAENLLPHDVVIVDEASMVDVALMAKLLCAVRPDGRVILLGDIHQLASVETGALLGDICANHRIDDYSPEFAAEVRKNTGDHIDAGFAKSSRIQDNIYVLQKSYRFDAKSGIGKLSKAINSGDTEAVEVLLSGDGEGLESRLLPDSREMRTVLTPLIQKYFGPLLKEEDPERAFKLMERFRILCAHRLGPHGVTGVNSMVEEILGQRGNPWFPGRPVMVTRNDYNLKLFNGDLGIVMRHAGGPRVVFQGEDGEMRRFFPSRVPEHKTAYAMTVHKSQGSEFDELLFLLPDRASPVVSRELIYTAVTRARKGIRIWGDRELLKSAIAEGVRRFSGLSDRLA